jgi:hypothetical protein
MELTTYTGTTSKDRSTKPERGEREGEGTQALSLSSGTHRIQNSLAEHAGRLPVVVTFLSSST